MLNIHRILLRRLLASWLLISAAVGGALFYVGMEKIDDQLVALATAESSKLSSTSLPLLNNATSDRGVLTRLAAELVREHFIVVELYDRERRRVLEQVNPRHRDIEEHLKQRAHGFPLDGRHYYNRFAIDGQTVLQVMVPLKDAAGATAGFFEGVFLIDPALLERLRRELLATLAVALGTVLATTLILYPVILSLNRNVVRISHDLLRGNIELMEVLGSAIAKRDSDTSAHNYRVAIYAVRLAEAEGLGGEALRDLIGGAFLHDVGKIGISDAILLKPARLDDHEFTTMKTHVALGVDILEKSNWLQRARHVVEFHHEKFDGSGYLKGLKGEEIPLAARIFAVVDVFDALTSKRPYKEAFPLREAMAIIRGQAGSHFDPRLVTRFELIIEPLFRQISEASDREIEQMLRTLIERYFLADEEPTADAKAA